MKKSVSDNLKYTAVACAAVLFLALTYYLSRKIQLIIVFSVGMLLVAGAAALFMLLAKKLGKRSSQAQGPAAGTPEAGKAREKIEGLRKSFFAGIEQFQKAGKDLNEAPWFLMLGLSGVGKTEAIRHSGLSFPPNLQNEAQGAGGTHTLNWWFTKDAVVLDTVGEWFLEDSVGEWQELIGLLRAHRPVCPFNGIILAVSAESLMVDDDAKIKEKAGRIGRKLDTIQKMLELRFPVFVAVTKTDLVTGFREFFDPDIDQEFQNQMLGWSNASSLDEPFDFGKLESSLAGILESARTHRLALLSPEEEGKPRRRLDFLFRTFAFPDNLKRLVPRLKLYLEPVFLAGEWSQKPLFLRGIYFTSAKQEGWELDVELRDAFPIPDSQRIEESNPGKHRAHFLLDVFGKKVFEEKGLVLRAASARSHQRRKLILTWGTAFVALITIIFITRVSFSQLEEAIGTEKQYWAVSAADDQWESIGGREAWRPAVVPADSKGERYSYAADERLVPGGAQNVGEFLGVVLDQARKPMDIPWIFSLSADIQGDLDRHRPLAARALFESSVLRPLLEAVRGRMLRSKPEAWTPLATAALAQVVRIGAAAASGKAPEGELADLDALFAYALEDSPAGFEKYRTLHSAGFKKALAGLYGKGGGAWPPRAVEVTASEAQRHGRSLFVLHWVRQIESQRVNPFLRDIAMLTESGEIFLRAEERLIEVNTPFATASDLPATLVAHNRIAGEWERNFSSLAEARSVMQKHIGVLSSGSLEAAYDEKGRLALEEIEKSFGLVLAELAPVESAKVPEGASGLQAMADLAKELRGKLSEVKTAFLTGKTRDLIRRLDQDVFKVVAQSEFSREAPRSYEARHALYQTAYDLQKAAIPSPDLFTFASAHADFANSMTRAREQVQRAARAAESADPRARKAADLTMLGCALAERLAIFAASKSVLDSVRNGKDGLAASAAERAKIFEPVRKVRILMTASEGEGESYAPSFHPLVLKEALKAYGALVKLLGSPEKPDERPAQKMLEDQSLFIEFRETDPALRKYFHDYVDYWVASVRKGFAIRPFGWKSFVAKLAELSQWDVNTTLAGTLNVVEDALKDPDLPMDTARQATVKQLKADIQAGRERIKAIEGADNPFIAKCKSVVGSLGRLKGESAETVRLLMLELAPEALMEKYIVKGSEEGGDVVLRYWEDLTFETLNSLATDFQDASAAKLDSFEKYRHFPLARAGSGKTLTPAQVQECRDLFDSLRPNPFTMPKESAGAGAKTGIGRVDEALLRLAWAKMPEETRKWVEAADQVLGGLPPKGAAAFSCEMTILNADWQKDLSERTGRTFDAASALPIWRSVALFQGRDMVARRQPTDPKEDKILGSFAYPGAGVRVAYYKAPSDQNESRSIDEAEPWGPVMLLHTFGAQRKDGGLWIVPLSAKDAKGMDRVFFVQLKFEKPLPDLKDWPQR